MEGLLRGWIIFCVYWNCLGWLFSALGILRPATYVIAFVGLICLFYYHRCSFQINLKKFLARIKWRCRKPLFIIFIIATSMAIIGALLYAPNNYDAITYRLPRMFNWLAKGHWHWINTPNQRMNFTSPGWEWIAMPIFVLSRSDRMLFLINALSFILMPGLLFSIFKSVGLKPKDAWTWMWIWPLAYGYILQAGSIGNDITSTSFCLLAIYFALKYRQEKQPQLYYYSLLSVALMSAIKTTNLPLFLPWLAAIGINLVPIIKKTLLTTIIITIGLLSSGLPTLLLNKIYTGSITGDPSNHYQVMITNPIFGLIGNIILVLKQALMPPLLPGAQRISLLINNNLPNWLANGLKDHFPRYFMDKLNELPQEESAGLGLAITILILTASLKGTSLKKYKSFDLKCLTIGISSWIATFFFMIKMGSEASARLLTPYYPLILLPFIYLTSGIDLHKCKMFKLLTYIVGLSCFIPLILMPSRPLFPALYFGEWLQRKLPSNHVIERICVVYATYRMRNDLLGPIRDNIPKEVNTIAFIAGENDSDYSLWYPFGKRKLVYTLSVSDEIKWFVIKEQAWHLHTTEPFESWLTSKKLEIKKQFFIRSLASKEPDLWYLIGPKESSGF